MNKFEASILPNHIRATKLMYFFKEKITKDRDCYLTRINNGENLGLTARCQLTGRSSKIVRLNGAQNYMHNFFYEQNGLACF